MLDTQLGGDFLFFVFVCDCLRLFVIVSLIIEQDDVVTVFESEGRGDECRHVQSHKPKLLSFPVAVLLIKNVISWNFYASFGVFIYVVALFFLFQNLYNKGTKRHETRLHDERPIPKITKESLAAFAEKMQMKS